VGVLVPMVLAGSNSFEPASTAEWMVACPDKSG